MYASIRFAGVERLYSYNLCAHPSWNICHAAQRCLQGSARALVARGDRDGRMLVPDVVVVRNDVEVAGQKN